MRLITVSLLLVQFIKIRPAESVVDEKFTITALINSDLAADSVESIFLKYIANKKKNGLTFHAKKEKLTTLSTTR